MIMFLLIGVIGVGYLTYSIFCRRKINMYLRHKIVHYSILDKEAFLKVQLYASIFIGLFFLASAVAGYIYLMKMPESTIYNLVVLSPLVVYLINYGAVQYSLGRGYLIKNK